MKLIFSSDLHIHTSRIGSKDGGKDRLLDGLSALDQILQYGEQYHCPVVLGGDLKTPKSYWIQDALNGIIDLLATHDEVFTYMYAGNHDGIGITGSGLLPFNKLPCVRVFEGAEITEIDEIRTLVIPHGTHPETHLKLMDEASQTGVKMVMGHAFLHEASVGPIDIQLAARPPREYGLGEDYCFDLGLFGDVHKAQWYRPNEPWPSGPYKWQPIRGPIRQGGAWRGEAFYPGSPYQQSWGEHTEWPKGCLLVDVTKGTVNFLPISSPRFVKIEWPEESMFTMNNVSEGQRNFVRIITGPWGEQRSAWFEEWRTKAEPRTFEVIVQRPVEQGVRAPVHAGLSQDELLKGYLAFKPPSFNVPQKVVLEAGKQLLGGS